MSQSLAPTLAPGADQPVHLQVLRRVLARDTDGLAAARLDEARVPVVESGVIHALRRGRAAGPDPWNAWTLEWSTSSPPPAYNFEAEPEVRSRRPLWDLKHPEDPDWKYE